MSYIDELVSALAEDKDPIMQEAAVQPLRRFIASARKGGSDSSLHLDGLAIALTAITQQWLKAIFDIEVGFYPDVARTEAICADLSAFIVPLILQLENLVADELLKKCTGLAAIMFPPSEKSQIATDLVTAFRGSEHDSKDEALNWSRTFNRAVDLLIFDGPETIDAKNATAGLKRITFLPATLPYPGTLMSTIDAALTQIEEARLGGPGLWVAPLTADQIQHAIAYGTRHYGTAQKMDVPDLYDVYISDAKTLLTIATVFGRIAAYAGQCARTGSAIEPATLEAMNFNDALRNHFGTRLISNHKRVSLMLFSEAGMPLNMVGSSVEKQGTQYHQTCYFPLPKNPQATLVFELGIPKMFGGFSTSRFSFDLRSIH